MEKRGIKAVPSIQAIGDAPPTKEAVISFIEQSTIDHVVAVQVGAYDIQVDRVPESVVRYYTGPYYVILTTSVYDAKTEQLSWGGRSKSFDVAAVSQIAGELAKQMVGNMSNR